MKCLAIQTITGKQGRLVTAGPGANLDDAPRWVRIFPADCHIRAGL